MRRHENAEARRIDEMNRRKSSLRDLFGPRTNAAEMSGIADCHGTQAGLARLGDREVHRFETDHLSITELPVNDRVARSFSDDSGMLIGDHHALGLPLDVLGYANDAMRFVPGKVGIDQMIADDPRFAARRS